VLAHHRQQTGDVLRSCAVDTNTDDLEAAIGCGYVGEGITQTFA
jgi:hypothetical protein